MTEKEEGVKFNKNSYLSIGIVVLLVAATLWIKDGQTEAAMAVTVTSNELAHYKELQTANALAVSAKIDALAALVKGATDDRFTGKDARNFAHQLKALNKDLKPPLQVPEVP